MKTLNEELDRMRELASNPNMTKKEMKSLLSQFDVVSTDKYSNNQGYGFLEAEMHKHILRDGSYLITGLPFSVQKARSVVVFNHYDASGELIKRYAG